jgi:hypothetical protein
MGDKTDSFRKWMHFKYIEKWFMRKADFISIPVESAREGYYPEFQQKIRIIPQGFRFEEIDTLTYVKNRIPTFAYAGAFIPGMRDPRAFLSFLGSLNQNFRFFVYTNNRGLIEPFQHALGDKLVILDYIPRNELLARLSKMDFLVNFDNNSVVQLPSKLIDYALVGRPVINITNELNVEYVLQFLSGEYKNAMKIENINQYRIENVCSEFLKLIQETS